MYIAAIASIFSGGLVLVPIKIIISEYLLSQVEELMEVIDRIDSHKAALETCQYSTAVVESHLTSLQKAVDQLSLGHYSNLNTWVERLDKEVRLKLLHKLD